MASHHPLPDPHQHKRAKSVLRSFIHKRTPSAGAFLASAPSDDVPVSSSSAIMMSPAMSFLPPDHPHYRALGELPQNNQSQATSSPKKSREGKRPNTSDDGFKALHKKTMSAISLKSLAGKDTNQASKPKENKSHKPKKTKSSTNLASLLSRPKSLKSIRRQEADDEAGILKDKENRRPISSEAPSRPPIYAQFSTEAFAKQPLGGKFLEDEIDLYTPREYSPGTQRNFFDPQYYQPTLTRRDDEAQRQRSTFLPSSFSVQDITRRISGESSRHSADIIRQVSGSRRPSLDRQSTATSNNSSKTVSSRGRRVMAAVSSFGEKSKTSAGEAEPVLKDEDIDREFEAMLDRRNIPEHQRGKMRSLAKSMKKDFVKQDWAEIAAAKNGRPGTEYGDSSADATAGSHDVPEPKTRRPRARTFTLSRASSKEPISVTKKSKGDGTLGRHVRNKSNDSTISTGKSITASGTAVAQNLIAKAKGQLAIDFVSYLRKVQKPELVEVGRLHKLRLLLRNETVAWTDDFIRQGGMEEIVGLLHRTMEVEWREEHEDALLHEVLLCLKALTTTALALEQLNNIQHTLFPALLHMLFDEERKGPSEFTTRNIITSILFTYLKSAPLSERNNRAMTLLSYLQNPEPSESQRPVDFVLDMRRSRPYTVWCKEVVNVTKEVFWIFLHHLNVIALPSAASPTSSNENNETIHPTKSSHSSSPIMSNIGPQHTYMLTHFPTELPPVPAAPYVGGVEWDATNYLASHLDLINGILSSLPTRSERNALREQLRVSGWEKCMGGTLRLCKEKFYGGVHAGLRGWVAAAQEDGWGTGDVRCGVSVEKKAPQSPAKEKARKKIDVQEVGNGAPRIEMVLDFEAGRQGRIGGREDVWL